VGFLWICRNRRAWHAKKTPTCFGETFLERMQDAGRLLPHQEDPWGREPCVELTNLQPWKRKSCLELVAGLCGRKACSPNGPGDNPAWPVRWIQ
jgi:hypothetical protein